MGIEEGEFNDRASLRLSEKQEQLIHSVVSGGKKTIVLLVGGSAVNMQPWLPEVDAVLALWYPGEAGGIAVGNILNGQVNPSGKLPITYPLNEAQLPLVYNHLPTGRGDDYRNLTGEPLFPFGFGLSYTTFDYQSTTYKSTNRHFHSGDTLKLDFSIVNSGEVSGTEVVQCYLKSLYSNEVRPVQELVHFERVSLQPKEQKVLKIQLPLNASFSAFGIPPGAYEIQVGSSCKDIRMVFPFQISPIQD